MSTGRSPPATLQAVIEPAHKRVKIESDMKVEDNEPVLLGGIDSSLIARLPRSALIDIITQALPTSTALKAIVLDKLETEQLLVDEKAEEAWLDEDATDLESLSGEEVESSQQSVGPDDSGPLAGLSVLARLIMEIMNSAPAPEGGMPWKEFEGIWPEVMGSVKDAIEECKARNMLVALDDKGDFVVSTMPQDSTLLDQ